jgi:hypothetical protein
MPAFSSITGGTIEESVDSSGQAGPGRGSLGHGEGFLGGEKNGDLNSEKDKPASIRKTKLDGFIAEHLCLTTTIYGTIRRSIIAPD